MTIALNVVEAQTTLPLVTLHNVSVKRGANVVLNQLNATFRRGEIAAIIGLNGSGKSTLLRTLLKEFPYTGEITFHCGHDHRQPNPKHVGYVPQRLAIDPKLPCTVRDVLAIAIQRRPIFFGIRRKVEAKLLELLSLVGLPNLLDVPVDGLSGGQMQRVLLALALEPSPELLLLDEPAAGIDFQSLTAFYRLIRQLNEQTGLTVIVVSHDLAILPEFAHQVCCLKSGSIQASGAPSQVLRPEALANIYGVDLANLTMNLGVKSGSEDHVHTGFCAHG